MSLFFGNTVFGIPVDLAYHLVIGVAMIHQCQTSEASAAKFKTMLEEFYADSPERLEAAQFGLTLTVKKPASDTEQD